MRLKIWLKCSVNHQTQQPLLAATLARKSLADVIVLRLLMWSDKQSYEPSAARENMEEEGRLRDENKWVWLNRGYWFVSVSRRAGENKGLPSENKGVCPSPSPFYWSKLRCKPPFQHSHYYWGTKEIFLCFVLMWTCTRVLSLSTQGQKHASALTNTNACCDLQKASCGTQTLGRWCPWVT